MINILSTFRENFLKKLQNTIVYLKCTYLHYISYKERNNYESTLKTCKILMTVYITFFSCI